jgi:hypothetical protein
MEFKILQPEDVGPTLETVLRWLKEEHPELMEELLI